MRPVKAWALVEGGKVREFDGMLVYRTREEAEAFVRLGTQLVRVEIREVVKKARLT